MLAPEPHRTTRQSAVDRQHTTGDRRLGIGALERPQPAKYLGQLRQEFKRLIPIQCRPAPDRAFNAGSAAMIPERENAPVRLGADEGRSRVMPLTGLRVRNSRGRSVRRR